MSYMNLKFMKMPKIDQKVKQPYNKKVVKCSREVEIMDNFGMSSFEKLKAQLITEWCSALKMEK